MLTCLIEPDLIKMTSDGTLKRFIALIGFYFLGRSININV